MQMKNSPAGLNSRFEMTEDRISELNNSSIETIKSEEKRKKDWQNEQFQIPLGQCHVTYSNIYVMIVSEGEVRKKGAEKTFEEKIAENFPKLMKNMNI